MEWALPLCSRNTEFFMSHQKNGGREENGKKCQKKHQAASSTFWHFYGPKKCQKRPKPRASIDLDLAKKAPQSDPPKMAPKLAPNFSPKKGAAFWGCRGVDFWEGPKKDPLLPKTQTPDFLERKFPTPQKKLPKTMAP